LNRRECGADYNGKSLTEIREARKKTFGEKRLVKKDVPETDFWRSKVWTFDEYINLPEYNNVYVRMFGTAPRTKGKGAFPYTADLEVTRDDLDRAKSVLSSYTVVGLLELYEVSIGLTLQSLGVELDEDVDFLHERSKGESTDRLDLKKRVETEVGLRQKIEEANSLDIELYDWAVKRFCEKLKADGGPALIERLEGGGHFKRSKYDKMCPSN
jgi:hypothetical protein